MMKNAKLNNNHLEKLFELYEDESLTDTQFKILCIKFIEEARVPNESVLYKLKNYNTTRGQALVSVNNFILKGTGDGVI
jgi:hypothetical protein